MTDYAELVRRLSSPSRTEQRMTSWDIWRKAIADGDCGSWPRDSFESMLEDIDEGRSEAADAIKELVAERDDYRARWESVSDRCNSALFDLKYARKLAESLTRRAERAEADLAAARAALRDPDLMRGLFGAANGQAAQRWASLHADAIAAAQAEKEVSDE